MYRQEMKASRPTLLLPVPAVVAVTCDTLTKLSFRSRAIGPTVLYTPTNSYIAYDH